MAVSLNNQALYLYEDVMEVAMLGVKHKNAREKYTFFRRLIEMKMWKTARAFGCCVCANNGKIIFCFIYIKFHFQTTAQTTRCYSMWVAKVPLRGTDEYRWSLFEEGEK